MSGILNAGNSSVTLDRILHERLNLRVLFLKSLNYFSLVAKLTSLTLSIAILIFASSRSSVAFMFFSSEVNDLLGFLSNYLIIAVSFCSKCTISKLNRLPSSPKSIE